MVFLRFGIVFIKADLDVRLFDRLEGGRLGHPMRRIRRELVLDLVGGRALQVLRRRAAEEEVYVVVEVIYVLCHIFLRHSGRARVVVELPRGRLQLVEDVGAMREGAFGMRPLVDMAVVDSEAVVSIERSQICDVVHDL